ncbi:MAG: TIM barrel protein [Fastidiosipilaceae bacterium]|jgi:inosose dehydratase|nr:TIM barrel protein [Clostridiaceae bacterium]
MAIKYGIAPSCWGVDDVNNPHLPKWTTVLDEAAESGFKGIELGPYGYISLNIPVVKEAFESRGLTLTAGTIFDDLVSASNYDNLIDQAHKICDFIRQMPEADVLPKQKFRAPVLTVMDYFHAERSVTAGHPDRAPRLEKDDWNRMMQTIRDISKVAESYGIRAVIHPHAGGYIEFEDEIEQFVQDVSYDYCGLVLDTGHIYYAGGDPSSVLIHYQDRLDYVHFKDVNQEVYDEMMKIEIDFFDACGKGAMCPIGAGALNYPEIRKTLDDIGYEGWVTIEQEKDPRNVATSLEDVKASYRFVQTLG